MSLTNRILLAMVAGIALGSLLEWLMGALDPAGGLHALIENGLYWASSTSWAESLSRR